MSEKSTNAGRLDNWDANQSAHEQQQWEDSLYAEAGKSDFSDEARTRATEAQDYENHMAALADRSAEHDTMDENRLDAIDRTIQGDRKLKNMAMQAGIIRELAERKLDGSEDSERLVNQLQDKEDRLQELLEDYMENGAASEYEKDEIMNRIIDMTRTGSVSTEQSVDTVDHSDVDPEVNSEDETEVESSGESNGEDPQESDSEAMEEQEADQKAEEEPELEATRMTEEELSAKRAAMVRSGLTGLEVGNMSDEQIEKYNLVAQESVEESEDLVDEEYDEGDSAEGEAGEQELESVSEEPDSAEIDTSWVDEYEDGEKELIDSRNWAQRHWDDIRTYGIGAYLGGKQKGFGAWLSNRRNPNFEQTRDRRRVVAAAIGGAAIAAVAAWFVSRGDHDTANSINDAFNNGVDNLNNGADNLNDAVNDPDVSEVPQGNDGGSELVDDAAGAPEITPDMYQDFNVESGHGFTREWQQWGGEHGYNMSEEKANALHQHLVEKFGKDGILSTSTYLDGGDVRISTPGAASWKPGVVEEAVKWLNR